MTKRKPKPKPKRYTWPGFDVVKISPAYYQIVCTRCGWKALMVLTKTGVDDMTAYHNGYVHGSYST